MSENLNTIQNTWRFLNTGTADAYTNMAVDEAILLSFSKGEVPPTIRFYRWDPPAVTIGYFQRINEELDTNECSRSGVQFVRRLTGGRAVYHHQELTYSLITRENDPLVPGGILSSYLAISKGLLAGLNNLGLKGTIVDKEVDRSRGTAACFDAPSWYEITVEGKKVIGSAQTRKMGCLLQHGSIPKVLEPGEICRLLKFTSPKIKEYAFNRLSQKAAGLQDLTTVKLSLEQLEDAFLKGFIQGLGLNIEEGKLTPSELAMANYLYETKYSQGEWIYKR